MNNVRRLLLVVVFFASCGQCYALSEYARSMDFVELSEIDPTILVSLRYITSENFLGTPVDGYRKTCVVLTRAAAEALKAVQEELKKDGYCLVVYDAYRPQQAVDHFVRWSEDVSDQKKKAYYYPRVDKAKTFELGYIARRSGHSRGSTVDLTIIKDGKMPHKVVAKSKLLLDGFAIKYLDDGTVNMGSSFDLFDVASHYENNLIKPLYQKRRTYLKTIMNKHGFKNYAEEWWHFTLRNEPYPADQDSSYFNFAIE